jgi:mannose/fructose/N-acetylgalactosamine-specific phosphotransferase system component IIC
VWFLYSAGVLLGFALAYLWPAALQRAVLKHTMGLEKAVSACKGLAKVLIFVSLGYAAMLPLLDDRTNLRRYFFAGLSSSVVVCVTLALSAIGVGIGLLLFRRTDSIITSAMESHVPRQSPRDTRDTR